MTEIRDPETGEVLPPQSPRGIQALIKLRDVKEAFEKAKREKAGQDLGGLSWEQFKKRVARERQERAEALEADAATIEAMSPRQQAEHFAQLQKPGAVEKIASPLPQRATIALQDIRTDELREQNREREKRENDPALLKRQVRWDARVEKFHDERKAAEAKAEEAKKAARAREQEQLEELGERPALEMAL
jgi:hypothetical protein